MTTPLVEIRNLSISFQRDDQLVKVVEGINLTIHPGETMALVGESGSGKSVTARALIGLSAPGAIVKADLFEIDGLSVLDYRDKEWRSLRGHKIGFVLQDALVSLDPLRRISQQLSDAFGVKGFSTTRCQGIVARLCCARLAFPTRIAGCCNIHISFRAVCDNVR